MGLTGFSFFSYCFVLEIVQLQEDIRASAAALDEQRQVQRRVGIQKVKR